MRACPHATQECRSCWRDRIRSVNTAYHPSARPGSGRMLGQTANRRWDERLDRYEAAVKQGIHPRGTRTRFIDEALRLSEMTQQPFVAPGHGR
jgi:hypothetical protein